MNIRRNAVRHFSISAGMVGLLAGCAATPAGPTVGVMPGRGKSFAAFQTDNATCKAFAGEQVRGQADAANQRAFGTAALATVLATGLGAATGGLAGDAGGGAAVGAAAGAGGGALFGGSNSAADQVNIQQQYDTAFSQCMYSKGDQVPGYTPVVVGGAAPDPTVRAAQTELNRLGYLREPADGYAGSHTRTAIASFEQSAGLPVDGVASPGLVARLQSTPANTAAAAPAAPANWVAPTDSAAPPPPPARTTTAASSGWVAPTKP